METEMRPPLEVAFDSAKMSILGVLVEAGRPLSSSEIASQSEYSRSTVCNHIDRLIELTLVERIDDGHPKYQLTSTQAASTIKELNQHLRPAVSDESSEVVVDAFME